MKTILAAGLVLTFTPLLSQAQEKKTGGKFNKIDTDQSGSISLAEFTQAVKAKKPEASPAQIQARFTALDANKSGDLSKEEMAAGKGGGQKE